MKNILLLSTGGTIASTPNDSGLVPSLDACDIIGFVPQLKKFCRIDCKTLFNLDSSNIQPEEWRIIAREVFSGLPEYDGIVILHGTDTMAYTASILSFMLVNLQKPVILTGSQMPVVEPGTDAKNNLLHAFLAATSKLQGVYIAFGGKIIKGCRAVKVRTLSLNAFESINAPDAGHVENGELVIGNTGSDGTDLPASLDDSFDPDVFLLKLIPGTRLEFFDYFLHMGYKGLVIEGFGLGGMHYVRRNLLIKLHQLLEAGVAIVVTTQCPYEMSDLTVYEVGRKVAREGIIPAYDMTSVASVTKLMWVLGHTRDPEEVRKRMLTNYCGEINVTEKISTVD